MADAPAREDVPEAYRWDTTALYADAAAWRDARDRYERRIEAWDPESADLDDAETLAAHLERRDDLRRLGHELTIWAQLQAWTAVEDDEAQGRVRRVDALNSRRDAIVADLERGIRDLGEARVDALRDANPRLARWAHAVDDVFRRAAHALDPAAEDAVAALDESLDAPSRTLRTVAERAFDPPTVTGPDGDDVTLTPQARSAAMRHPDRDYRERVADAYRDARRENASVAAQAYLDHCRAHAARADLRDHPTPLSHTMDGHLSTDTLRGVVDAVRDHGETFARRVETVGDRNDLDELRPFDLRAPLRDAEAPEIPYDEATDLVLDSVRPLGDAYADTLADFLERGHVDVRPHEGKRPVPAAMFGSNGTPAYVFATYDGDLESLYFLAHELGHVVHYRLAREAQPPTYQRLGWYVGELPSFLAEVRLTHHLLDGDRVPDPVVLDTFLGRITPAPPARGAEFTHRLFDALADDEALDADAVCDVWRDTGDAFLPPVTFTQDDGHRWLNLSLDRDPFHAYYYLVGRTCALALAAGVADGSFDAAAYREFLRAGDSADTSDLLDRLDLDLGSGAVVEAAGSEFDRLVAHY